MNFPSVYVSWTHVAGPIMLALLCWPCYAGPMYRLKEKKTLGKNTVVEIDCDIN